MFRAQKKDRLCKRFRTITLIFTATMFILYFIFGIIQKWPVRGLLLAGILSIVIQTVACYIAKEDRNIYDTIRVGVMLAFTIYLMYYFGYFS
jgi:hypothetical protein